MNRSQQLNNITKENDTNNSQDITQNSVFQKHKFEFRATKQGFEILTTQDD